MEEAAEKFADRMKIAQVNTDGNKELTKQFKVFSIPTVVIVKNGEVVHQKAGALQLNEIEALVNQFA